MSQMDGKGAPKCSRDAASGYDKVLIRMLFLLHRTFGRIVRLAVFGALPLAVMGGCTTLPSSGPTGSQIIRSAGDPTQVGAIKVVELREASELPQAAPLPEMFHNDFDAPPTDMVGPGDTLDIAVYETGVALFAGNARANAAGTGFSPTAQVERLLPQRVDDNGDISLPYVGRIRVIGLTLSQVEVKLQRSLHGMSQNPQVVVTLRDGITNTVVIGGEVGKPGRLVLPTNRETVSDAVALAGGYRGDAKDLSVFLQRQDRDAEFRLSDLISGPLRTLRVYPGDRISVVRAPRTFSVLGAPGRVEQITFAGPSISLTEAVATAGGTNPSTGDPRAIFVFRRIPGADDKDQAVVYHLNMMSAGAYFLAQRFVMRDKDVLYIGNARANQPSKLIQIISQLFSPIVTVTSAVQVLKN